MSSWDCIETAPANMAPHCSSGKQIERLNRLPEAQRKIVMQMLDGVLSQTNR